MKLKEILKYVCVWIHFGFMGFVLILLLVGAFQFANAIILNKDPGFIEWLGMIFVVLITGTVGLVWFINDTK